MNERPNDRPQVDELEVGDVIHTDGLDGLDDTEVRVLENSPLSLDNRYLVTEPADKPGAVTRGPQRADTVVTRVRRAGEMTYPQFLRKVADLLEQVPEIPRYRHGLDYSAGLPGEDDELAAATLLAAHEALDATDIPHEYKNDDHSTAVTVTFGRRRFHVSHVYGAAWARHKARQSYVRNVQVDAEGGA